MLKGRTRPQPKQQSKTRYHHGNLRQALIDEGTQLLDRDGATQFSLREVAKAAGVSHGAPYRHFPDRTALLEAIAAQGFANLTAACQTAVATHPDDPRRQLLMAGRGYVDFAMAHPGVLHLMFGGGIQLESAGAELQQAWDQAGSHLVGILDNGCRKGIYRAESAENLTMAAWSMAHGLSLLLSSGPLQDVRHDPGLLDQLFESVGTTLFEGLLARS